MAKRKRYYQSEKDRMDESRGMKKAMDKKKYAQSEKDRRDESRGMKRAMDKRDKKERVSKDMKYISYDDSLFGFPAKSMVAHYPEVRVYNQYSDAMQDDIAGQDYEIDSNVMGLNKNKARSRF